MKRLFTEKLGTGPDPNASLAYHDNKVFSLQEASLATGGLGKSIIRLHEFDQQYVHPQCGPFSKARF